MDRIDAINRSSYDSQATCAAFAVENSLQIPEMVILDKIRADIKGAGILDVGVGGGRTIKALTEICDNYTGIDYSQGMVNICKEKHPNLNIFQCDARDMSIFKDESFGLVFFSYNGIDYVSHDDRMAILKEIFRVLKTSGYFVFSAHNRNFVNTNKKRFIQDLSLNPVASGKCILNRIMNRKFEESTAEYAIINDSGQDYSLLTYYIDIKDQVDQLYKAGFSGAVEVYDLKGHRVTDFVSKDPWVYYCVKKRSLFASLTSSRLHNYF
jgi:ubiquinone/menaquinone biosynthesis C-methylase UbiE